MSAERIVTTRVVGSALITMNGFVEIDTWSSTFKFDISKRLDENNFTESKEENRREKNITKVHRLSRQQSNRIDQCLFVLIKIVLESRSKVRLFRSKNAIHVRHTKTCIYASCDPSAFKWWSDKIWSTVDNFRDYNWPIDFLLNEKERSHLFRKDIL